MLKELFDTIAIILVIVVCVFYFLIIYEILNFQIDHKNPLDIAGPLNSYIYKIKWILYAIIVCFLFDIYHNWIPFILHALIAYCLYQKTRERNYFEPLVIVRDANTHKYTFSGFLVISIISLIYQFVILLILLLTK